MSFSALPALPSIRVCISILVDVSENVGNARWKFRYDSSTDYADYPDEMKPEPTFDADPANDDTLLLFLARRGKLSIIIQQKVHVTPRLNEQN